MRIRSMHFRSFFLWAGALLLAAAPLAALSAEETANAARVHSLTLALRECIELALKNNLGIKIQEVPAEISREDMQVALAEFDPTLTLNSSKTHMRAGAFSFLQGAALSIDDYFASSIGLSKKFSPGTVVNLEFATTRYRSNSTFITLNPNWDTDFTVRVTQPLLRNFGPDVNKSQIYISEHNTNISKLQLELQILSTIAAVERGYWELVFAINDLKVKDKSLQLAGDLLRENEIRVENEVLAQIEVTRARAGYQGREADVIRARNRIKSAEDALRRLLNIPGRVLAEDYAIIPSDSPAKERVEVEVLDAISQAFQNRPDYFQFHELLQNLRILEKVNKNQLLPSVNFEAYYTDNGLAGNFGNSWDKLSDGSTYDYGVGLQVEIPIGNRRARSEYAKSQLDIRKTTLEREDFEQAITIEIKEAVRNIKTNLELIKSTEQSVTFYAEQLDAEEKKLAVGISRSRDVLDAQDDLVQAESLHLRAVIDYNIALTDLEKAKGTLSKKWGFEIKNE